MRLWTALCILLACMAIATATDEPKESNSIRPKRHLQFWKDLIAAKLGLVAPKPVQREENVMILKIPGFENVLVRAVPKLDVIETPAPVPETIVQVDPTMALLGAYLGTKTPEETLIALQRVKGLLQSGIIKAREEVIELMPPKPPVFVFPQMLQSKVNCPEPRPIVPVFQKTPLVSVPYMPVPALRPAPVPIPMPQMIIDEIRPIEVVPTEYSYKQINGGKVTSYYSRGGDEVIVTQTNQPPPPPPRYVIDRIQKMIYGLPLGVATVQTVLPPVPTFVQKPYVDIPVPVRMMPGEIISGPSTVDVKVNDEVDDAKRKLYHGSVNIFAGTRVMKEPFTSTFINEEVVMPGPPAPLIVPAAPVETSKSEENKKISYKHIHGDGTFTTYSGTTMLREPFESMTLEHVSKLPAPPPELVHRIKEAAAKAHHPKSMWGYSFKIANGEGYYENTNKDKIYYSRLTSGGDKHGFPAVPDPLSSNSNQERKPHNNLHMIDEHKIDNQKDDDINDDLRNPFLSTKVNGEVAFSGDSQELPRREDSKEQKDETTSTEITPIKMIPRLPTPIVGENNKDGDSKVTGGSKYSYTLVKNDGMLRFGGNANELQSSTTTFELSEKEKSSPGTLHTYTQINGNKATTVTKEEVGGSVLITESVKNIPRVPSAIIDVVQPLPKPDKVAVEVADKRPAITYPESIMSSYMYKQINDKIPKPFTVVKVENVQRINGPKLPSAIIDVIQPLPKPYEVAVEVADKRPVIMYPESIKSSYMYKKTNNKIPKPFTVVKVEDVPRIKVPKLPSAIIDVVQPLPKLGEVAVEVADKRPAIMYPESIMSSYMYKQINNKIPKPFTVVKVEDVPRIKVPKLPSTIIDVVQPLPKPVEVAVEVTNKRPTIMYPESIMSSYMYKQINNKIPKPYTVVKVEDVPRIKVPNPSAIIDVIQPLPKPVGVAVEVAGKPPAVMFPEPVMSSYMYKQINSHTPNKPFTVVRVEDVPRIELPKNKGDVHVKVNMHEHVRADGTRYPCSEVHLVPVNPAIPIAPIPMIPTAEVVPSIPSELLYVPPAIVDVPVPSKCHPAKSSLCIERKKLPTHFSYTQVNSKKDTTTVTVPKPVEVETTTTEKPLSLNLNPIVVAEGESNYSYTQTNSNGSSVNIQGNKDNTVSVKVEDSNGKSNEKQRGDIPEALA